MYYSQQHGRRGQRIDTRQPGRQSSRKRDRDINSIYMGEVKLVAFVSSQEMVSTRFLSLWIPR